MDDQADAGQPGAGRPAPRFVPPLPGAWAEVRPWWGRPGPDVAAGLLAVSEPAVRVCLRLRARAGDRFQVTLRDPIGRRWAPGMADLCWATPLGDGTVVAVLALARPLGPDALRRLAGPPAPAVTDRPPDRAVSEPGDNHAATVSRTPEPGTDADAGAQ